MELSYAQKGELVDALLDCPALADDDQRRAIVKQLLFGARIGEDSRKDR